MAQQQSELVKYLLAQLEKREALITQILEKVKVKTEQVMSREQFIRVLGLKGYHYDLYARKCEAILSKQKFEIIERELTSRKASIGELQKKLVYNLAEVSQEDFQFEIHCGYKEQAYLEDIYALAESRLSDYKSFKNDIGKERERLENGRKTQQDNLFKQLDKVKANLSKLESEVTSRTAPQHLQICYKGDQPKEKHYFGSTPNAKG